MEAITLAALLALVKKIVDVFKYVTNKDINGFVTQVVTWTVGVFVMWLAAQADITASLAVFGHTFGDLDGGSIILGGMIFASGASALLHDIPAALDNTDSAHTPPLIPTSISTTIEQHRS